MVGEGERKNVTNAGNEYRIARLGGLGERESRARASAAAEAATAAASQAAEVETESQGRTIERVGLREGRREGWPSLMKRSGAEGGRGSRRCINTGSGIDSMLTVLVKWKMQHGKMRAP